MTIIFLISRGVSEYKYTKYVRLFMLERALYLVIILLLVKYRFQHHRSYGEHNAKVGTVNLS